MKHLSTKFFLLCLFLLGALNCIAFEILTTIPDIVLGQPDFYHNTLNYNAKDPKAASAFGLHHPNGIGVGFFQLHYPYNIAVADTKNNRIMIWKTDPKNTDGKWEGLKNGQAAEYVLGQPDFTRNKFNSTGLSKNSLSIPYDVALINDNIIIADSGNNRIIAYMWDYNTNRYTYKNIYGQDSPDIKKIIRTPSIDERTLFLPKSVLKEFISDFYNHRILFYKPELYLTYNKTGIEMILGQNNYYTSRGWNKDGVSASSLAFPRGIASDKKNLYVADFDNHRVLIYINIDKRINLQYGNAMMKADYVLGQAGDFTSRIPNKGGVSAKSLFFPADVTVDTSGNLYVADMGNHRVLKFNNPLKEDDVSDQVFGQQTDFTTRVENKGGLGPESLSHPSGVSCDERGNLYISDTHNNRILIFYCNDIKGN